MADTSDIIGDNAWDNLDDDQKMEIDEGRLREELSDEFMSGDPDSAISRAEDQGIGVDELIG